MKATAAQIRRQLARFPNKQIFKKGRDKLLEIAILLEIAHQTITDQEVAIRELRAANNKLSVELKRAECRQSFAGAA